MDSGVGVYLSAIVGLVKFLSVENLRHKHNSNTLQTLTVGIQALHKMATGSYLAQHLVLK